MFFCKKSKTMSRSLDPVEIGTLEHYISIRWLDLLEIGTLSKKETRKRREKIVAFLKF